MQSSKTRLRELGECWFACVAVLLCLRAAVDSRRGVDSLGRGPGLGMLGVHEADYIDGKVGGRQNFKRPKKGMRMGENCHRLCWKSNNFCLFVLYV